MDQRDPKTAALEGAIERAEAALRQPSPGVGDQPRLKHGEIAINHADLVTLLAAANWRVAFVQGERSVVARDG